MFILVNKCHQIRTSKPMFYEDSNSHNGFRRLDLKSLFLNKWGNWGPERGNDLPKVTPLIIGRARTRTQFFILSTETFSSYNNGFWVLCRGERYRPKVRWIQHAQRLNSKEVQKMHRLVAQGGPESLPPTPEPRSNKGSRGPGKLPTCVSAEMRRTSKESCWH